MSAKDRPSGTMAKKSGAAWRRHLKDPRVQLWYDAMTIKSGGTAEERLRVLARYCDAVRTTPAEIVRRAESRDGTKAVADELQRFAILLQRPHRPEDHGGVDGHHSDLERCARGHAPGYVLAFVKSVRAWLRHNDIGLVRKIAVGDSGATPTVEDERPPTPEELHAVLENAPPRAKVIIAFVAFSALRPEVLGMKNARDGLRLRDLRELVITRDRTVRILKTPMAFVVRRELSKVHRKYITFLPALGCDYLRSYLRWRLSRGEDLGPDSPVVRPDYGFEAMGRPEAMRGSPFLGRQGISKEIRTALRARDLTVRPYALRSYAESAMLSAEREGKITSMDREFWCGRKGTIDQVYTNRKDLSAKVVEEMRTAYAAAEPYLTARVSTVADEYADAVRAAQDALERDPQRALTILLRCLNAKPNDVAAALRQLEKATP